MDAQRFAAALVSIATLAVSACAVTPEGLELNPEGDGGQAIVTVDWRSSDDLSGTMTVSVSGGRIFSGGYVWITAETPANLLQPLWLGWSKDRGWPHWQPGPDFVSHYRGEILASLRAANGERMRCRFKAANRSSGMNGGGEGSCQFANGNTLGATVAAVRST